MAKTTRYEEWNMHYNEDVETAKDVLRAEYIARRLDVPDMWSTAEVKEQFEITRFLAPRCFATRYKDGAKGAMFFSDVPVDGGRRARVYYDWRLL